MLHCFARKLAFAALLLAALPAQAAQTTPLAAPAGQLIASTDTVPLANDSELALEHERFSNFAREHVQRMNANIIGGKHSMAVRKGHDGLYHASYKAIDVSDVVCQVRRAEHDPNYYVGVIIYKEVVLASVAKTAEACRKAEFAPVTQTPQRLIFSSKRGGGW